MEVKIILEINNEFEAARLLSLIDEALIRLYKSGRQQQGIDGYTLSELNQWKQTLEKTTSERCKYPFSEISKICRETKF